MLISVNEGDWSRLRTLEEIFVGASLAWYGKIDNNPALVGQLVNFLESFRHSAFPFCVVVRRLTASEQETAKGH
jgi:hypothetical protein